MELGVFNAGIAVASLAGLAFGKRYFNGSVCRIHRDLTSKTVIITGATSGIGKETARSLAKSKATVILACRNREKALDIMEALRQETNNLNIQYIPLDLSSLKSIKEFSKEYQKTHKKLDILINNAAVINFQMRLETKDGFEGQFAVNYLGHFYLTNLLSKTLQNTPSSRVINVTCSSYSSAKMNWQDLMSYKSYGPLRAYAQSKLAMVLFTKELNKRLAGSNMKAVSVHPGSTRTNILGNMPKAWYLQVLSAIQGPFWYYFTKTPWYGAQGPIYCSLEDFDKLEGGEYYAEMKKTEVNKDIVNDEEAVRLWKKSTELLLDKKIVL